MTMKKLTRIAVLAFAVAMLLAVSSLAYSINFYGNVEGLEDGVEYTCAQYDFTADAYGEFAELTDTTVLTSGIWGIKAGDAEPEAVFVYGKNSGKTSFWTDGATGPDSVFDNTTKDTYVPGKWTISSNGAFNNIRCYKNAALTDVTVCIDVVKAKVIEKKTITTDTQKTVTVGEATYPVYLIDDAEYYLVTETTGEGEEAVTTSKYLAVADGAEYAGENAESAAAVYLTDITWVGIEGEGNKSQESVYYYGFTNAQVIPASELEGYTVSKLSIFTGGMPVANGHLGAEASPKFTYFTKKIGSDEVTEYSVKLDSYKGNAKVTFPVPEGIPADAYIVGFAIAPYDGLPDDFFTNLYDTSKGAWNTESNGYFHHSMAPNSSNGLTVTAPALTAPAPALTVVNGKVTGLEDGKLYEYAKVAMNSNGTAVELGTPEAFDKTSAPVGLFVVREINSNGQAGEWTKPLYIAGNSISSIYHTTYAADKNGVMKNFIDVVSAGAYAANAAPKFIEAKWAGFSLTNSLAKNYGYDPLILGTTSGQGTFSYLNTTDATALAAAQIKAKAHLETIYYSYTYTADEIVPVALFESFRFRVQPRGGQGLLNATAGSNTKITFKVITEDGTLEDRVVYKPAGNLASTLQTVTAADLTDKDGYIVAICINPYTVEDATTIAYKNSAMIDFNIYHYADGYSVDLPKAEKPTGLYIEDGVIKGLDPDTQYGWVYQYISGTSGTPTAIPAGSTEFDGVTGLVGISVIGGNVKSSDPVLFYIPGDNDAIADLGIVSGGKPAFESSSEWKPGIWTGDYLSWYDWNQTAGAYTFLDQSAGVTAEQAQNLWLYQVTKEEAQARLDADKQKSIDSGVPTAWTNNKVTSDPDRLQAVIDAHYTEDYEEVKDAKMAALKQNIADGLTGRSIRYAYDETEIIPVDQLIEMSFSTWRRQGSFKLTGVKSKVIFTVMQLDGTTSDHEWWSNEFTVSSNVSNQKITVDVQSIEGLPEEGYIVGVELYPWATMNASEITYVMSSSARVDASNVAYSFDQQHISSGYYYLPYEGYKVKAFAVAPELTYTPAENGGYDVTIADGNASLSYRFKAEGADTWTNVAAGVLTFNVPQAGKYVVEVYGDLVAGTASATVDVAPVAPTAPEIMYVPSKDGYVVKIMNYFGAYTYEYKLATATKWTKVPAGDKTFAIPYASEYVVRAGGETYDGYAETSFTVEPLPAALESLTVADKTITGMDATKVYEYAPVTIHGIGDFTAIPAGTEFTVANAGLYVFRIAATETEEASSTRAILVYGDLAERKTIINTKTSTYGSGTWYDKTITSLETIQFQSYSDRLNPTFVEGVWTGYKIGDLAYWNKDWQFALGVVSGCVPKANLGDKITAGTMTQQEAKDFIASYGFRYAYKPDEIIPFEDLVSFSFSAGGRQGHVYADGKAYTKVIAHVANEYGLVETRELLLETNFSSTGSTTKHKISAESFGDTTGYIVGFELIPYGYIPEETTLKVVGATDSDWMVTLHEYEINLPRVETPVVTYNAETKLVEGLSADVTYTYAPFTVNGEGTATTVTGVTTLELADGLWGIRRVSESVDNSNSLPAFVLIQSDLEARKVLGTRTDAGYYAIAGGDAWQIGKWSGKDIGTGTPFGNLNSFGTYGGHVYAESAKALMNAIDAGDASAEGAARALIVDNANNVKFKYAYGADDIISVKELKNLTFTASRRMGSLNLGYATAKVYFSVVCPDGKIRVYTWESDRFNAHNPATFNVNPSRCEGWPEEGYIVGFAIHPWSDVDPSAVKLTDRNGYNTMANLVFDPDKYLFVTGDETAEKPVITYKAFNNVITVTNYNNILDYAYSTDGGETWTEFDGNTFNATKASTSYIVKSLESYPYPESEYSDAVTSAPVALVGTSLVLDGQIGLKVYMDVDLDSVDKVQHYMTKVNKDYASYSSELTYGQAYRMGGGVEIGKTNASWATEIQLDEESGLYYFIIYLPAKDLDNTSFETDLGYWPKGSTGAQSERVQVSNVGLNFANYIAAARNLAAAGNAEFIAAMDLVDTLETYASYADNYFNKGTDAAYVSTASTEDVEAATRTNATLTGAEFYGTSLLLEDQVTIRHYFAVTDMDAFKAAYDVAGKYGTKGSYVYFDIADIPAQELGDAKTLSITDMEGNTVYEIKYSVTNYIVNMMNDDDANLVSLVNAMYDYYLAAEAYVK